MAHGLLVFYSLSSCQHHQSENGSRRYKGSFLSLLISCMHSQARCFKVRCCLFKFHCANISLFEAFINFIWSWTDFIIFHLRIRKLTAKVQWRPSNEERQRCSLCESLPICRFNLKLVGAALSVGWASEEALVVFLWRRKRERRKQNGVFCDS